MTVNEPPLDLEADDEPADPGESPAEQAESLARVERGGIPLGAERRLRELGEHGGAFTSDLSVGDFALCHQLGLKPVSQVMGSSIYQVGYQSTPWPSAMGGGFMFEMQALSEAWNEVRELALGRLAQEAQHVGADAVVGVEMNTGEHDWAENAIEYVVIGTAIRHESGASGDSSAGAGESRGDRATGDGRRGRDAPVLTELSVADYAKLLSAGVEPLGVVAWSSVFFVGASYSTQMMSGIGGLGFTQNQELPEFTQGVYSARESVVSRLADQAARLDASGVIGVRIAHGIQRTTVGAGTYSQGGLMVTFHAIGTAIREDRETIPYAPETIVDLTT
ncbi:MAG TPA: heavy metal-binding domain-containing protein [Solirubrobacteraceae bacterium]